MAIEPILRYQEPMNHFQKPRSLTELVTDRVRRDIINGTHDLGAALSEAAIAKTLDVSRTPVREAFARLEIEGLVRSEPQRGTYVFSMCRDELIAICDVRVILETGALQLSARGDSKGLHRGLSKIVKQMTKARSQGDDRTYLQLDAEFHQALIDSARNPFLGEAYQTIAPRMAALRNRLGCHPDHMQKSYDEHCRITKLAGSGEIDAASALLVSHIGHKEGSYWSI